MSTTPITCVFHGQSYSSSLTVNASCPSQLGMQSWQKKQTLKFGCSKERDAKDTQRFTKERADLQARNDRKARLSKIPRAKAVVATIQQSIQATVQSDLQLVAHTSNKLVYNQLPSQSVGQYAAELLQEAGWKATCCQSKEEGHCVNATGQTRFSPCCNVVTQLCYGAACKKDRYTAIASIAAGVVLAICLALPLWCGHGNSC